MAGGGADAPAALMGCDVPWGLGLSREELRPLAAERGSDIGFPLYGGVALCTGRGELLTPLETSGAGVFHWAFTASPHGLATPTVFQEYDRLRRTWPAPERVVAVTEALDSGDAALLAAAVKDGGATGAGRDRSAACFWPPFRRFGRRVGCRSVDENRATCRRRSR